LTHFEVLTVHPPLDFAGMDGVFVGSGIFKSGNPTERATAIVKAVTHFNDAKIIAEVSENLGEAMVGINSGPGYIQFSNRDT
jgi:pyridoxal biosynthesis lyase PdxS